MDNLIQIVSEKWLETLPLIGLYAETHFRFPIPFSRYFKKEPELIFDTPWRLEPGLKPLIFLVVKDAHKHPVILKQVEIDVIQNGKKVYSQRWELDDSIESPQTHREFELAECPVTSGAIEIIPSLQFVVNGKLCEMRVDNYRLIKKPPLRVMLAEDHLPKVAGWLAGDTHLHSSLTTDQIEFGASLEQTRLAAQLAGLEFIAATDHSYDLDDRPDNYLKNDPELRKWKESRKSIAEMNSNHSITIIPGEEISVANKRGATVHFLHFNDPIYFPGSGDSGEDWPKTRSQLGIEDVLSKRSTDTVSVGAHTAYKFPWLQRVLLNRGFWESADHDHSDLDGVQILCGTPASPAFHESRQLWIDALLRGRHLAVYGGSDGHGNFNRNWHVKLPVWSLGIHEDQIFGQVRTLLRSESAKNGALVEAMQLRRTALSTGPVGDIKVVSTQGVADIGDTITFSPGEKIEFAVQGYSSKEFGDSLDLSVFHGDLESENEALLFHRSDCPSGISIQDNFTVHGDGYLRLEITSEGSRWPGLYMSSPIWFQQF